MTGTGLVLCSCHNLVRGNGVGDLQKGEQSVNNLSRICYSIDLIS